MTDTPDFSSLGLSEKIVNALTKKGYSTPSPVQAQAIPYLVEGRDLFGCAQTGTGKTAAFSLPLIHRLMENREHRVRKAPRALILSPTRELAAQIAENVRAYAAKTPLKVALVHGGVSFGPQKKDLNYGTDILVATPGRLMDLTDQGFFEGDRVQTFILDEADRMLDMGFSKDVERISMDLNPDRQTVLFSATISKDVERFAANLLKDPVEIRIDPEVTTAEKIDQQLCFVKSENKRDLLLGILEGQDEQGALGDKVIVFTKTKYGADKLCKFLTKADFAADAIHGDKSQASRKKALSKFQDGRLDILVATDVAARGIDVKSLGMVINYEIPMEAEAYIHRIGRTARAGQTGMAVSFCGEDELFLLKDVTKLIQQDIPVFTEHEFHSVEVEEAFEAALLKGRKGKGGAQRKRRNARSGGGGFRGKRDNFRKDDRGEAPRPKREGGFRENRGGFNRDERSERPRERRDNFEGGERREGGFKGKRDNFRKDDREGGFRGKREGFRKDDRPNGFRERRENRDNFEGGERRERGFRERRGGFNREERSGGGFRGRREGGFGGGDRFEGGPRRPAGKRPFGGKRPMRNAGRKPAGKR